MQWLRGEPHADLVRHRAHGDTGLHGSLAPTAGQEPGSSTDQLLTLGWALH